MKRSVLLALVWLAGAAAAVGLGVLAVSLVGAPAASSLRAGFVAAGTSEVDRPAGSTAARSTSGEQATAGGIAYASCLGGKVQMAAAPASGWTVETGAGQVEFRAGNRKIEVGGDCSTGSPQFTVEEARPDGGVPAPVTQPAPSPATTVDDHGGDAGNRGSAGGGGGSGGGSGSRGGAHGSDG